MERETLFQPNKVEDGGKVGKGRNTLIDHRFHCLGVSLRHLGCFLIAFLIHFFSPLIQ